MAETLTVSVCGNLIQVETCCSLCSSCLTHITVSVIFIHFVSYKWIEGDVNESIKRNFTLCIFVRKYYCFTYVRCEPSASGPSSKPSHSIPYFSLEWVLVLSSHLCVKCSLIPASFATFLINSATRPAHLMLLNFMIPIILDEEYKLWIPPNGILSSLLLLYLPQVQISWSALKTSSVCVPPLTTESIIYIHINQQLKFE